ncbi:MAG: AAA family ATPase [Actinobacteria bacterium]|nr:AAA family ATPase [Actinomycetota bacterium]
MTDLSGRPLGDTRLDRNLYLPRPEHELLRKSAEQGLNVLVVGERGSGKTTLLRQLALDLREAEIPSLFVDGKLAEDAASFLEVVRYQLGQAPNLIEVVRERYARALQPRPDLGEATRLLDLIEALRDPTGAQPRTVLLVDGVPSGDAAHSLFGRLRDELWQLPFNWIVAGDERDRAALLQPPADAFFDRLIELRPLKPSEQLRLLKKRLSVRDAEAVKPLLEASGGNPRGLLALARDALEGGRAVEDVLEARALREAKASKLSRPASMLLAELEAVGSASASDEDFLRRLGWTRVRAVQVFSELEQASLVESETEKGPSGRPRKVYRPRALVAAR